MIKAILVFCFVTCFFVLIAFNKQIIFGLYCFSTKKAESGSKTDKSISDYSEGVIRSYPAYFSDYLFDVIVSTDEQRAKCALMLLGKNHVIPVRKLMETCNSATDLQIKRRVLQLLPYNPETYRFYQDLINDDKTDENLWLQALYNIRSTGDPEALSLLPAARRKQVKSSGYLFDYYLENLNNKPAIEPARKLFAHDNPLVRRDALRLLYKLAPEYAGDELTKALYDSDSEVILAALKIVRENRLIKFRSLVTKLTNHKDYIVSNTAMFDLPFVGEKKEKEHYIMILKNPQSSLSSKFDAALSLTEIGDKDVIPQLEAFYKEVEFNRTLSPYVRHMIKCLQEGKKFRIKEKGMIYTMLPNNGGFAYQRKKAYINGVWRLSRQICKG